MNREKIIATIFLLPFFIIFFMFIVAPFIWILINSFVSEDGDFGFYNYREIFESRFFMQSFLNSFYISFISSFIALIISLFGSYSLYKIQASHFGNMFLSLNTMTSNFSGVPLAFAFIILMGANGAINLLFRDLGIDFMIDIYGSVGINLVYIYFQIPLAILLLYPAFHTLDQGSSDSSDILGASRATYWFKVALPIMMPPIIGVFIVLFANAIGAYATIYALSSGNFNVIPVRIASLIAGDISLNPYLASALSVMLFCLMLVVSLTLFCVSNLFNYKRQK
ncbi:spermidine/putrescine ABC transporter, permease component [Campylobacter iguaniorum]|uniref:Spermidine/putrescine ABC transporter, permease component n=1 Tax=Campylobacter iguaniorum TaxID=1244531 RepID=A0A076F9U8_9BACT|nr:ABC transporter permease [Campylobacter iguaniorum]AII14985.1 spermidine/putrescine ABC transporter, permease component [Campylobacter iguaniorum]ALV24813.1 spermidine/putrescine ABC transporter, permease component [Campylobacter iguaniorum]